MKRHGSKNLKLIAMLSLTLFSLFTCFSAAIAWFESINKFQDDADQMKVTSLDRRFDFMTLHRGFYNNDQSVCYFDTNPKGTFSYDFDTKVTTYEPTDSEDSEAGFIGEYSLSYQRHPVLALVKLTEQYLLTENNPLTIRMTTDKTFIGLSSIDPETSEEVIPLDPDTNPLSSVIKFTSKRYADLASITTESNVTGKIDGVNTTFTTAYSMSVIDNTWLHFVDIGTDESNNLRYDGWTGDIEVFNASTGYIEYVAIIFDYYDDALDYIYTTFLGHTVLEQDRVPFDCDWTMEI